jgi:hypothetical protein
MRFTTKTSLQFPFVIVCARITHAQQIINVTALALKDCDCSVSSISSIILSCVVIALFCFIMVDRTCCCTDHSVL